MAGAGPLIENGTDMLCCERLVEVHACVYEGVTSRVGVHKRFLELLATFSSSSRLGFELVFITIYIVDVVRPSIIHKQLSRRPISRCAHRGTARRQVIRQHRTLVSEYSTARVTLTASLHVWTIGITSTNPD